jgi:hypothetical protein
MTRNWSTLAWLAAVFACGAIDAAWWAGRRRRRPYFGAFPGLPSGLPGKLVIPDNRSMLGKEGSQCVC